MKECKQEGIDGQICHRKKGENFCYWLDHLKNQNREFLHKDIVMIKKVTGCLRQEECLEYIEKNKIARK